MIWFFLCVLQICVYTWELHCRIRAPGSYRAWVADGAASITILVSGIALSIGGGLLHICGAGLALLAVLLLWFWWKKRPPRQRRGSTDALGAKSRAMRDVVIRKMREAGEGLRRPVPVPA